MFKGNVPFTMASAYISGVLGSDLVTEIYQSVGEASMCWEEPEKAGSFKATEASRIALDLCKLVAAKIDPSYKEYETYSYSE